MALCISRAVLLMAGICLFASGCSPWRGPSAWQDPLRVEEHAILGEAYLHEGALDPAAREYAAILAKEPAHVPALMALGQIAFEQWDWPRAVEYYRRVLAVDAAHAGAANNLAMAYLAADEHLDEAERLARQALAQQTPFDPYIRETLASLYVKQGRWHDAREVLEPADMSAVRSSDLRDRFIELRRQISLHP